MSAKRNLLIVLGHGLRSDALGDSQRWPVPTPELSRMGEHGLRLVATSACPCDSGGMASLLTGLHARQHGRLHPDTGSMPATGFPLWLREAGYRVAGVGCVSAIEAWLDDAVVVQDVAQPMPTACAYTRSAREWGLAPALELQRRQRLRSGPFEPDRLLLDPAQDVDGYIADQAAAALDRLPEDAPWALIVMTTGPGNDLPPPSPFHAAADVRALDEGFIPPDFTALDALAELDYPRAMLQRLDPLRLARLRADYLGRVCFFDEIVGRLHRASRERADAARNWSLVASDRGQLLGEHGLIGHRSFLAGAVETPILVVPPTPCEHRFADGLCSTVDVAATVAELAGADAPAGLPGASLLEAMHSGRARPLTAGCCVSEFGRRLMLETERFRVVFDAQTGRVLGLFDLVNDPDERRNLSEDLVGRNALDALRCRLGEALMPLRAMPA